MPMTLISRTTLSGTAASVTFNSIPQTYQTLKLVVSARSDLAAVGDNIYLQFNADTGANYSFRRLEGNGATASSSGAASNAKYFIGGYITGANATASTFGSVEVTIPNYSASTNKAGSADAANENNATTANMNMNALLWSNTSAISSLVIKLYDGTNFAANSTFSLYGVS